MNKTNFKNTFSQQHQQKVDELVAIAKEQGYITYEEINEILPMTFDSAEQIDQVLDLPERNGHPNPQPSRSRTAKRTEKRSQRTRRASQNALKGLLMTLFGCI